SYSINRVRMKMGKPKGEQVARLRQRKYALLRRYQIPDAVVDDLLPGSLSRSRRRCGKSTCHCATGPGHPSWYLAFMVGGKQRVVHIPAAGLVWALLVGQVLREWSFHGVEALVRSPARRALGVRQGFGDDTLAYFTERLDPGPTREAMAATVRRAKRNKGFGARGWIGLAIDGTGAGRRRRAGCALCHPRRDAQGQVSGYLHH